MREAGADRARWGAAVDRGVVEATCVALGLSCLVLLAMPPAYPAGVYGDDGAYLALGKALAEGVGYRSIYAPGAPVHTRFPPGLPLLVTLLWGGSGDVAGVLATLRVVNALAAGATAGMLWRIARARLGIARPIVAAFVAGPFLLDGTLQYFGLALAEPYFMLGWALALAVVPSTADGVPPRRGRLAALGLVLGVAAVFRTQAIALIPAMIVALRVRRVPWGRMVLVLVGAGVPLLVGWLVMHPGAGGGGAGSETSYGADLAAFVGSDPAAVVERLLGKAVVYPGFLALYVDRRLAVGAVPVLAGVALAGTGLIRLRRRAPELVYTVLATLAVLVAWPQVSDRLILSALPFLGVVAGWRLQQERWLSSRRGRVAAGVIGVALALVVARRQAEIRDYGARAARRGRIETELSWAPAYTLGASARAIEAISAWVSANTAPPDRLLTPWPEAVYLRTGRTGVNYEPPAVGSESPLRGPPGRFTATHVLSDHITVLVSGGPETNAAREIAGLLAACPGSVEPAARPRGSAFPQYYRVTGRRLRCLGRLADADSVR